MRLSDIMSFLDLHVWAEVALVIFLGVFVLVVARILFAPRWVTNKLAALPLQDDNGVSTLGEGE
ncbi:MAG: hypothetical protein COB69_00930 [Phycisphaera sp.]|nr:MAG: hypothetical protein COB69_00930 [Phycisphaera sp.]